MFPLDCLFCNYVHRDQHSMGSSIISWLHHARDRLWKGNFECASRNLGLSTAPIYGHAHGEPAGDVEVADPNYPTGDEAKKALLDAQHAENRVAAIMLESGVIFHSIFIGIDLGINPDSDVVRPLMIALMFHQV